MDITSLILSKKYVEDSLAGAGAIKGLSAYEVAQSNGFTGSEQEWLNSLNGVTPHIGENGNWFIGDTDCGVVASPSLAGFATEDFVKQELNKIDLTPYATKTELTTAISKIIIPDVSNFVTQKEIDEAIEAIPEVNLTAYATKEELQEAIKNIDFPTVDLSLYALKSEIPSLAGYATEDYVNQQIEGIEHPQQDLSDYAKKSEIPDTTGLASETWVNQMIQNAQLGGDQEVDLTNYPTREEVQQIVESEISEIVHPQPDLSGYALKTEIPKVDDFITADKVDEKIAEIQLPDLTDYAKKSDIPDVSNFITEENLPSLEGYATEDFVTQKIAEAELNDKEVDLSAYYTKSEVDEKIGSVSFDGYATEQYVQEVIKNINIESKEATIYEITTDETSLEGIAPTGVNGDFLIITNSTGVKTAYINNGEDWIACDGAVDASKVIMPMDITLAGSYSQVGNLTKSSTGTAVFETKGKSVAAALQEILSKREQPSITSYPFISCSASNMSAAEVGTTVTPGWSASLNPGSYTYGPATGITATSWTVIDNKGNSSNTSSGTFPSFTLTDTDNYSYTVSVKHGAGAIAYDNLGEQSNPIVQIAANSANAISKSGLKGYRQWFIYVGTNNSDVIDSNFIRNSATAKGNASSASTINNLAIPAGTTRVVVAIPQKITGAQYTYGKSLTSVIDVDGMGLDVFGNFSKSEVNIEGKNGAAAVPYNVWVCENANGLAATKYNLVIG